jgi:hypothetical protein
MRVLNRKLLRDLWRLKWQMGAIAMLIACGVSVAVMAFSTQKALVTEQSRYSRRPASQTSLRQQHARRCRLQLTWRESTAWS